MFYVYIYIWTLYVHFAYPYLAMVQLLKESETPPFVGSVPFLCAYVAPLPVRGLWEFLDILIIILIQFKFLFIHLFIPYNTAMRTTNTQSLPYRLEWPNKKIYGERLITWKPVQREKNRDSLLSVAVSSLHLSNQKGKKTAPPPRRVVAHASRDFRTITFSGEIHSEHKHTLHWSKD